MTDCRATISHRTMTTVVEPGCPYATPAEHRGAVADGVNTALRLPTQPLAPRLRWESDFKYVRSNDLAAAQAWSHARPKKTPSIVISPSRFQQPLPIGESGDEPIHSPQFPRLVPGQREPPAILLPYIKSQQPEGRSLCGGNGSATRTIPARVAPLPVVLAHFPGFSRKDNKSALCNGYASASNGPA